MIQSNFNSVKPHLKSVITSIFFFVVLLLIGLLTLHLIITTVESKEITVNDNGGAHYTTIQQAVDVAMPKDIILVEEGIYKENVLIDKAIDLKGTGENGTFVNGSAYAFTLRIVADEVNVSGFTIILGDTGILLEGNHCSISDNSLQFNNVGLSLVNCDNNSITRNRFYSNYQSAMIVSQSSNNSIIENDFHTHNFAGISLDFSNHNSLLRNNFNENGGDGIQLLSSSNNSISENIINSNGFSGINLIFGSNDNAIDSNYIHSNWMGISLDSSSNNEIIKNNITNNRAGIVIFSQAHNTTAIFNSIVHNFYYGIEASSDPDLSTNATLNWWGHNSGPSHPIRNPDGEGDNITVFISFTPWLESDPFRDEIPIAIIDSILPNPALYNETIAFKGHGHDNERVIRYKWHSNISEIIYEGTESNFTIKNMVAGNHTITFQVQNGIGTWSRPVKSFLMILPENASNNSQGKINIPPILLITYPLNNSKISGVVQCFGYTTDPDGNTTITEISFNQLEWVIISQNISWNLSLDSNQFGDGDVAIMFRAFDGYNYSNPQILQLIIHNQEDDKSTIPIPNPMVIAGLLICIGTGGIGILLSRREDTKYSMVSLFISPLYSRLRRGQILGLRNRSEIYSRIVNNPGINFSQLLEMGDMGNGTLVHHLEVLQREKYISSRTIIGRKIFFPKNVGNNFRVNISNFPFSKKQKLIIDYLLGNGPSTMSELQNALHLKQPTVSYNIRKLLQIGIITASYGKRNAVYKLTEF